MSEIKKQRRHFESGFKKQVVMEVERGELSLSAAGRKYELSPILISQWRDKFREGALSSEPTKKERELEKEIERYKLLLAEAHADREFLKKAQDYARRLRKQDTAVITGQNYNQLRTDVK